MPVQPPFYLIPQLAALSEQPNPLASLVTGAAQVGSTALGQVAKHRQDDLEAVRSILGNFDVRPVQPGEQPGTTVGQLFKALRGGREPSGIPAELLGFSAVPKNTLGLYNQVLRTVAGGLAPGEAKRVQGEGGILKPGTLPGLQPDATITGKKPTSGSGRGPSIDTIFSQSSTAARSKVNQLIQQALVNPESADVKNFPVLDPRVSRQMFLNEVRQEALLRGAPDTDIEARLSRVDKDLRNEEADFQRSLKEARALLQRNPAVRAEVLRRLGQAFPRYQYTAEQALR